MKTNSSTRSGFTLVELMIATALFVLVTAMILMTFMGLTESTTATTANSEMNSSIRYGLDIMTRDIRKSSAVIGYNNGYWIILRVEEPSSTTTNLFYRYNDQILKIVDWHWPMWPYPSAVIASGVTNIFFTFYKNDGTPTVISSQADMVDVSIATVANVRSKGYEDSLKARVKLRNRNL